MDATRTKRETNGNYSVVAGFPDLTRKKFLHILPEELEKYCYLHYTFDWGEKRAWNIYNVTPEEIELRGKTDRQRREKREEVLREKHIEEMRRWEKRHGVGAVGPIKLPKTAQK